MASPNFYRLPVELTVHVFEQLDGRDLISCSLVCRLFNAVIRDTDVLQYNIELTADAVEDNGLTSKLLISERLSELKASQESWATLRFRKRQSISMSTNSPVWELIGGYLARGAMALGDVVRGLSFFELPSALRNTPGRAWEHRDMGVAIRDFTIDPTQDLAVLIAYPIGWVYMIHLRTMSAGKGHPSAVDSVLSCVPDALLARACNFIIQIMGEHLVVHFHALHRHGLDQLFLWNWRTGRLLAELNATTEARIDSFSFLSPRHFVVSRFQSQGLGPNIPTLEVYDFHVQHTSDSLHPKLVRSFDFPEIVGTRLVMAMLTRSNPSPQCSPLPSDAGNPFGTSSAARVLAVTLSISRQRNSIYTYVLFVHHSTLLDDIEDGQIPGEADVCVPWEKWGPQESRMLPTSYNEDVFVCFMHGTRYVRLDRCGNDITRGSRLRTLDFNPLTLYREYERKEAEEDRSSGEAALVYSSSVPTLITGNGIFSRNVVTALPFREMYGREIFNYRAIMIEEGCLVGRLFPAELCDICYIGEASL